MREWQKYWQGMATTLASAPASEQENSAKGLRVDIAGCRVMAPPVRQQQGANYIPRIKDGVLLPPASPMNWKPEAFQPEAFQEDEGGKRYVVTATPDTQPAATFETAPTVSKDATGKATASSQRAAFREFFAAAIPLADDVLFVPIAPATAA